LLHRTNRGNLASSARNAPLESSIHFAAVVRSTTPYLLRSFHSLCVYYIVLSIRPGPHAALSVCSFTQHRQYTPHVRCVVSPRLASLCFVQCLQLQLRRFGRPAPREAGLAIAPSWLLTTAWAPHVCVFLPILHASHLLLLRPTMRPIRLVEHVCEFFTSHRYVPERRPTPTSASDTHSAKKIISYCTFVLSRQRCSVG